MASLLKFHFSTFFQAIQEKTGNIVKYFWSMIFVWSNGGMIDLWTAW
jgi:hypothetical protein